MAPIPTEDIDFPSLSDQILVLLLAVWTFVCDFSLAVWDYVSEAFWAAWTYPPFETFRNALAAFFIVLMDYVAARPITSAAIAILVVVVVPRALLALKICRPRHPGSERRGGASRGPYAANYQSTSYGGNAPRGSTSFSQFQSQGAVGYRR